MRICTCLFVVLLLLNPCSSQEKIINGFFAGTCVDADKLISTAKNLGANAVVIDVKNDVGEVTCDVGVADAPHSLNFSKNMKSVTTKLKNAGITPIARIITFQDEKLANRRPELAITNKDKTLWKDKENKVWLDPFNKNVWKYILDISKGAVALGFSEIQFDYFRFSSYSKKCDFYNDCKSSRVDAISGCLRYLCDNLHDLGAKISVDVFGCVIEGATDISASENSAILGQDYVQIAQIADYICPMIYPSHFPNGAMGIEKTDFSPYDVVFQSMQASNKMLEKCPKIKAIVRPYLQAFTARWLKEYLEYGQQQINEQKQAVYDSGNEEWCLFNMGGRY